MRTAMDRCSQRWAWGRYGWKHLNPNRETRPRSPAWRGSNDGCRPSPSPPLEHRRRSVPASRSQGERRPRAGNVRTRAVEVGERPDQLSRELEPGSWAIGKPPADPPHCGAFPSRVVLGDHQQDQREGVLGVDYCSSRAASSACARLRRSSARTRRSFGEAVARMRERMFASASRRPLARLSGAYGITIVKPMSLACSAGPAALALLVPPPASTPITGWRSVNTVKPPPAAAGTHLSSPTHFPRDGRGGPVDGHGG